MNNPLVSVIVPVFNRPQSAVNAVRSVLRQDFTELEVIVADDGSSPPLELPEDVREDARVRHIRLARNSGAAAARNAGARTARGEWLAWLDSDDSWRPDKLTLQLAFLDSLEDRENVALASGFEYVDMANNRDVRIPIPASDPLLFFTGCWFAPGSSVILPKVLFERIGPYDERLRRLEDYDWFIRMALGGGRLEVVKKNLVTVSKGQMAPLETLREAGKLLLAKFEEIEERLPPHALRRLRSYLHLVYAASLLKHEGRKLQGLGHLALSLFFRPRLSLSPHHFWEQPGGK